MTDAGKLLMAISSTYAMMNPVLLHSLKILDGLTLQLSIAMLTEIS